METQQAIQPIGTKMLFDPHHPYQPPGQWTEDIAGRSGPTCKPEFRKYGQALIPLMYARILVAGTTAGAGSDITFTAIAQDNALGLFSSGVGGNSAGAGFPAALQNGLLSFADTSVAQVQGRDVASLAPDNDMVYRWFGLSVSGQRVVTTPGNVKQYGTDWLRTYESTIQQALLQEFVFQARFGSTTEVQNFGPGINYNQSRFKENDFNTNSASPVYTMCEVLTGSPNDSDKMTFRGYLPNTFTVGNQAANPTPAATTVYAQLVVQVYGWLECREGGGVCAPPGTAEINQLKNQVAQMTSMMAQMMAAQGQGTTPSGSRLLGSGR